MLPFRGTFSSPEIARQSAHFQNLPAINVCTLTLCFMCTCKILTLYMHPHIHTHTSELRVRADVSLIFLWTRIHFLVQTQLCITGLTNLNGLKTETVTHYVVMNTNQSLQHAERNMLYFFLEKALRELGSFWSKPVDPLTSWHSYAFFCLFFFPSHIILFLLSLWYPLIWSLLCPQSDRLE